MTNARRLRELLAAPAMVRAPGVYDGITATLAAQAGFQARYLTSAGTSMSRGFPDFGLLTLTKMAQPGRAKLARMLHGKECTLNLTLI